MMMDVYLVPISRDSFECYYEAPDDEEPAPVEEQGFFGRMKTRFQQQLREAEQARHEAPREPPKTLLGKLHRQSMRWIAERIAEQRLLWHLRGTDAATLFIPTDVENVAAEEMMRVSMTRDADRHLKLLILHSLLLILAVPLALVPGPNVIGYLFTFTVVGHYLSWRGAKHAVADVRWEVKCSDELAALRHAFTLAEPARHHAIRDVAHRLHLPRLAIWVERMAPPTA
jgi:hypothetical protein